MNELKPIKQLSISPLSWFHHLASLKGLYQLSDFIVKHSWVAIIFAISGLMLVWSLFKNRSRGSREVGAHEAVALMNRKQAVVLDVRDNEEFSAGHVVNAKHIPLGKLNEQIKQLEKFKNRPVVIVCHNGQRSANAAPILVKNGFADVFCLRGGIAAWQLANMPLEKAND